MKEFFENVNFEKKVSKRKCQITQHAKSKVSCDNIEFILVHNENAIFISLGKVVTKVVLFFLTD